MTGKAFPASAADLLDLWGQDAFVCSLPDPRLTVSGAAVTANEARGARVTCKREGTLTDLAVYVVASAGNIEIAVIDDITVTRNRLGTTGSVVAPAAGAWRSIGNPNVPVYKGQQLDLVVIGDNAGLSLARYVSVASAANQLPAGYWLSSGGAAAILNWGKAAVGIPFPATITEATMAVNQAVIAVIGKIT